MGGGSEELLGIRYFEEQQEEDVLTENIQEKGVRRILGRLLRQTDRRRRIIKA